MALSPSLVAWWTLVSRTLATALTAILALALSPAWAHKASDAYLQLSVEGRVVTLRSDVALRDLDRDLVLDLDDDGQLTWGEVRSRTADIQALADRDIVWQVKDSSGAPCVAGSAAPLQLEQHSDGRYAVLRRDWTCARAPASAELRYRLFAASDPTHRGVLLWRLGQGQDQGQAARTAVVPPDAAVLSVPLLDGGTGSAGPSARTSSDASAASGATGAADAEAASTLSGIFRDGVHHIWIGLDHVLFLVVLLLPAVMRREDGRWRPAGDWRKASWRVIGIVTAFTVAHSITLGLAVFELVQPPARWVESLIALSVLLAALNNLRPVLVESRWRFTFVFGLVHGFGFASALRDLGLGRADLAGPLVMFNLGVEAGQLVIVAVLVPLAWWARRWDGYARWILGGGSVAIAAIAVTWLVERLFDVQLLGLGA